MRVRPLSSVHQRIAIGAPLPFNVRNANRELLLARGQLVRSEEQMLALLERGALVDLDDPPQQADDPASCRREALVGLWDRTFTNLGRVLESSVHVDFLPALQAASASLWALIDRDPDLAIFRIVRQGRVDPAQYGASHSVHCAIATRLAAERLGWDRSAVASAFRAALTMNLSVLDLQGRLAAQAAGLTPTQRESIDSHPHRSARMLRSAGVTDKVWLEAVAQHHEVPGGRGYPAMLQQVGAAGTLVRYADVFTARLSTRVTRSALRPHQMARALYVEERGHPMVAALVKEFGIFPPGCCVRLASGEAGLVVKRGPASNTPIVATVVNRRGEPLLAPVRRATDAAGNAITGVIPESSLRVRVSRKQLVQICGAG
ncbi:hypothetical protein HLB44_15900 [Aquincola sp. S2]|uniref:Phosphohydrolase n=1 Tax=Pseudaquabacterium terrae TaxID=2732868 RepID=A0ABX2EIM7_9BURK|nr:HD domain-containing phosphohydrolase [Aquabacterium terrae]NRF68478.1 hypothetical protein [Aquabacterium terrae]